MTIPSIYISPAVLIALVLGIVAGYKFKSQIQAVIVKVKTLIAKILVPSVKP